MKKLLTYLQHNTYSLVMLILSFCFYLFFAIYDGPVIAVDSPSYINMSFSREPFYPLFLAFFRQFNPEEYLFYVVIFQNLLMAFCGWILADFLVRKFRLSKIYGIILYFLPIAVSLMNRFLAKRSSMYTNSILTEGICTSLYLLFIYLLMSYIFSPSRKKILLAWGLMFLMFSSRKQMMMTFPIFAFILFYNA